MTPSLRVTGARQHNLKGVSCDIPRDALVVITGPSGSGKSSLAFDTIYAEGQRRYVESLSAYARQFLEQLPKPDVAAIEGLSPAIAIEQKALARSPRSSVGTVTEINDYLRLLFARVGVPFCPKSGRRLKAHTVQEIVDRVLKRPERSRVVVLAPLLHAQHGGVAAHVEALRRQGFVRLRLDGETHDLAEELEIDEAGLHDLEVVVDRLSVSAGIKGRLTDSVELALRLGNGTVLLDFMDGAPPMALSERLVSWEHNISIPRLEPRFFSFNSPYGACPRCDGLGMRTQIDEGRVVPDAGKSLREGAVAAFGQRGSVAAATEVQRVVKALKLDPDTPWRDLDDEVRQTILHGTPRSSEPTTSQRAPRAGRRKARPRAGTYEGIIPRLERLLREEDVPEGELVDPAEGAISADDISQFVSSQLCDLCHGSRLREETEWVRIEGHTLSSLSRLTLSELGGVLPSIQRALSPAQQRIARPLIGPVLERLGFLTSVGLGYLCLDRAARTLSGGEGQRIRLATQIGASLIGVLYVLDEPSVGLHARDNAQLISALRQLVDRGNSVLVVEHDRDTILAADHVLDLGPGAGELGGRLVAQGTPAELMRHPDSVTGPHLGPGRPRPRGTGRREPGKDSIRIVEATAHNLKQLTVQIPLGLFTSITGVSGSGKSSLIVDTLLATARARLYGARGRLGACSDIQGLELIDKVISIDQAPIGRTPRSNPATYTGIFGLLRELYANLPESRARGYKPGRFSFNVKGGRCEACRGDGVVRIEMHFLPDVFVECDSCAGQRYNRETLEVAYRGITIAGALDQTIDEAADSFASIPKIAQRLAALRRVGLGYLRLGQPATTLSGGEAQRLKLARELSKAATGRTLFVLDEPTSGLHPLDVAMLLEALFELRDAGNTILVVEHNLDLIAASDWVIDLGPEGGDAGGQLVAEGPPEQVATCPESHTGQALARDLKDTVTPEG